MSIKRYSSDDDTTISNAFKDDLTYRATGSNMGAADTLEVFQIYGQESTSSSESIVKVTSPSSVLKMMSIGYCNTGSSSEGLAS